MKVIYSICLCFLVSLASWGQNREWQPKTRAIVANSGDSVVHFKILVETESVKLDNNLIYYWHNKGQICSNQGGYAGELLHGEYLVFNLDKKLITKGNLKEGLRIGVWKSWYENGNLKSVHEYSNGTLNGKSEFYSPQGKLNASYQYKKGEVVTDDNKGLSIFKSKETVDSTLIDNQEEKRTNDKSQEEVVVQSKKESPDKESRIEGRQRTARKRGQ
jgi:antitoxin component YwqK of YwqJK toxin-antitoxin module